MRVNVRCEEANLKRKRMFRRENKRVRRSVFTREAATRIEKNRLDEKDSFKVKEDSLRDVRTKMCKRGDLF